MVSDMLCMGRWRVEFTKNSGDYEYPGRLCCSNVIWRQKRHDKRNYALYARNYVPGAECGPRPALEQYSYSKTHLGCLFYNSGRCTL